MTKAQSVWPLVLVGLVVVALTAGEAQAAMNSLFTDGLTITELVDEDYEAIVIGDGDQYLEVGEFIAGVIKIRQTVDVSPGTGGAHDLQTAPDTFTALFMIEVAASNGDATANNGFTTLGFKAASQAQWNNVWGSSGILDLGAGANPLVKTGAGTMLFTYEGIPFNTATPAGASPSASARTFFTGGSLLYEFGFTGVNGAAGTDEFWSTIGTDADDTLLIYTLNPTNRFALNVVALHGSSVPLLPHNWLGVTGDANFTGETKLQLKGDFIAPPSGSQWSIGTDSNMYLKATPEPGCAVGLLGMAVVGLGLLAVRRRRR